MNVKVYKKYKNKSLILQISFMIKIKKLKKKNLYLLSFLNSLVGVVEVRRV